MKRQSLILIFSLQIVLFLTNCGDNEAVINEVHGSKGLEYGATQDIQNENYRQPSSFIIGKGVNYVGENLDSVYKQFYENGHIKSEVSIINGSKNGLYKKYDSLIDLPITVVEYIKAPVMFESVKTVDYVNRIWNYNGGDVNAIDASSELYFIKSNESKKGVDIQVYISNFSSSDGHLDSFTVGFVDYDKEQEEEFEAENIVKKVNEKVYKFEHIYTDEELKQGYVKGIIFAFDDNFIEKKGVKENYPLLRRVLVFNWLIKEGKVKNF